VSEKWIPESKKSVKRSKLMLMGTKSDLRAEPGTQGIPTEKETALAQQIGVSDSKECSTRIKLDQIDAPTCRKNSDQCEVSLIGTECS
jgi:hypothetical protein